MSKRAESGSTKGRILVVEDDTAIVFGLQKNLKFEGYEVVVATDGEAGLELAISERPDLIILDIMLPRVNGFEVCETLRKKDINIPIIFLTAKSQESDKILGLDLGGDDYMTKPFSLRELLARVKGDEPQYVRFGDIEMNYTAQTVTLRGEDVALTSKEFDLLRFLVQSEGKVLPRESILNRVWGYDYYGTARTIDKAVLGGRCRKVATGVRRS